MASLVTAELGTKDNPHPITPPVKDRIIGHYYIYKGEIRRQINDKSSKNGSRLGKSSLYGKEWRENNKEKKSETDKRYRKKNLGKIKAQKKIYYQNTGKLLQRKRREIPENREREREYNREWHDKNRERRNRKQNERSKEKYKNDPNYRLLCLMRGGQARTLKTQKAKKNQRTMEYVNCSVAHLHNHLESQFGDSGMNWDNMGNEDGEGGRGWEIDHRRPCASFDLNDEEQKYMCFHWTNLQPMWGQENNEKSNEYDPKTFRYKWIDRETGWVGIPSYLMNKK